MRSRPIVAVLRPAALSLLLVAACAPPAVMPLPEVSSDAEVVYFGPSAADLWALRGAAQLLRFDGTSWVEVPSPERVRGSSNHLFGLEEPCATRGGDVYVSNRFDVFRVTAAGTVTRITEGHPKLGDVAQLRAAGAHLVVRWWKPATSWYGTDTFERYDGGAWSTLAPPPGLVLSFVAADERTLWASIQVAPYEAQVAHLFRLRDDAWEDFGALEGDAVAALSGGGGSVFHPDEGWLARRLGSGAYGGLSDVRSESSWQTTPSSLYRAAGGALLEGSVPFPDGELGEHACGPRAFGLWPRRGGAGLVYLNARCEADPTSLDVYFQELSPTGGGRTAPWATLAAWNPAKPVTRVFALADGRLVATSWDSGSSQQGMAWLLPE